MEKDQINESNLWFIYIYSIHQNFFHLPLNVRFFEALIKNKGIVSSLHILASQIGTNVSTVSALRKDLESKGMIVTKREGKNMIIEIKAEFIDDAMKWKNNIIKNLEVEEECPPEKQ